MSLKVLFIILKKIIYMLFFFVKSKLMREQHYKSVSVKKILFICNFLRGFFIMKVVENSPQNVRNCTKIPKILKLPPPLKSRAYAPGIVHQTISEKAVQDTSFCSFFVFFCCLLYSAFSTLYIVFFADFFAYIKINLLLKEKIRVNASD